MCRFHFNTQMVPSPDWSGKEFSFLKNHDMWDFHRSLEGYQPTPLVSLPKIAEALGIEQLWVKDEVFALLELSIRHLRFVEIHPFPNGRLARSIVGLLLMKHYFLE